MVAAPFQGMFLYAYMESILLDFVCYIGIRNQYYAFTQSNVLLLQYIPAVMLSLYHGADGSSIIFF